MKEKIVCSLVVLFPLLLFVVFLPALPSASLMPENTPYEHVILIVIDGVRPDILVGADTPNIDNLTASGSFTWNAWTVTPSGTIAAIPSIFTGATPEVHGVTDWDGEIYAETIVEVFEEAGLPCAIVGEDPILGGYSATYCTGSYSHPQPDEHFMTLAIDLLQENDFYFISVYNPVPDHMGHEYGHSSPEYRDAIENADYHIGRLIQALKDLGVYDNSLIVITTDHGMTGTGHSAGYETDMRVFSIWHGPKVKRNYEMIDTVHIPPLGGGYAKTRIHAIDIDSWSEFNITWNNQPSLGNIIADNSLVNYKSWYYWDVTGFIAEQFIEDNFASIAMVDADENAPPDHSAAFETKEWGDASKRPYLEVRYSRQGENVSTIQFEPIDDSYVRQDAPNSNFGGRTYSHVGRYYSGAERAFFKFDLGAIPADASIIEAKYYNYCWGVTPVGSGETYVAHQVIDIAPTIAELVGVRSPENAEGNVITQIFEEVETPSEQRGVQVLISPSSKDVLIGENFTFTVTVKNTGNVDDTYNLTKWDNENWTLTLENISLTIPAGENRTTALTVTVPENVSECTRDNVRVKATSAENENVWAENSCIAHATENIVLGVEVSIDPTHDYGAPATALEYTVTVKNTGNVSDNYTLENSDNSGWSLTLSPSTLSLGAGASGTATLTVAIPSDAENCTHDNITVTATSSENATIENSATCVAHCVVGPPTGQGVQVTISETFKSGVPGDVLNFLVTVTNTGTSTDTFTLTAADTENWAPTVSPSSLSIGAGTSRSATLSIAIPSTAADGASTTITVTATSQTNPTVENFATCKATAAAGVSHWVYMGAVVVIVMIISVVLIFLKPF